MPLEIAQIYAYILSEIVELNLDIELYDPFYDKMKISVWFLPVWAHFLKLLSFYKGAFLGVDDDSFISFLIL